MHIHIHALIHYVRHARLLGSYLRFLGMMLLLLLLSLLQLVSARPASAVPAAKELRHFTTSAFCHDTVSMRGRSDPAPPDAMHQNTYTAVSYQLKPGIVMVPRMNRTPKPKSVYRCFTRAPGIAHCCEV